MALWGHDEHNCITINVAALIGVAAIGLDTSIVDGRNTSVQDNAHTSRDKPPVNGRLLVL